MTQHEESTQVAYEAFREAFGAELVGAVRRREAAGRRWRRRASTTVPAVAVAAAAFTAVGLSVTGSEDAPRLGAGAATAAVRELRDSLEHGVLVRVAVNREQRGATSVTTESDWTDLATRDRHTRLQGEDVDLELWNPSPHERWTVNRAWRSADGRAVVNYTDGDAENASSAATPKEEVEKLLRLARDGELTLTRTGDELAIERTERCFASADLGYVECPDPASGPDPRWPDAPPDGLKAVTTFETWWLAAEGQPRILRQENGAIDAGSKHRDVVFRTDYRRWDVLPATAENLRLVNPPTFRADRYLVLKGDGAVSEAIRAGRVHLLTGRDEDVPAAGPQGRSKTT
ncbi:MAG TPA: hypothetical protein VNS09_05125 [Solirubrobacter sp.]|nr:hypothetical protein [Solirubrobacter sp.]